ARVLAAARLPVFDLQYGQQVARGRSDEDLVGRLQIAGQQRLLFHPNPGNADLPEDHFAGNSRQATGTERWRVHVAAVGDEKIRRGAFGDFAVLIEQDHLIETACLRGFEPGQIHRPGEDFGAGKLAGGVARLADVGQLDAL